MITNILQEEASLHEYQSALSNERTTRIAPSLPLKVRVTVIVAKVFPDV